MKLNTTEIEKTTLLIRLERNQKNLVQLKKQLKAYTCEPKTQLLFELKENLRNKIDALSTGTNEILASFNEAPRAVKSYKERTEIQLEKFTQLQQQIEAYMSGARSC